MYFLFSVSSTLFFVRFHVQLFECYAAGFGSAFCCCLLPTAYCLSPCFAVLCFALLHNLRRDNVKRTSEHFFEFLQHWPVHLCACQRGSLHCIRIATFKRWQCICVCVCCLRPLFKFLRVALRVHFCRSLAIC